MNTGWPSCKLFIFIASMICLQVSINNNNSSYVYIVHIKTVWVAWPPKTLYKGFHYPFSLLIVNGQFLQDTNKETLVHAYIALWPWSAGLL